MVLLMQFIKINDNFLLLNSFFGLLFRQYGGNSCKNPQQKSRKVIFKALWTSSLLKTSTPSIAWNYVDTFAVRVCVDCDILGNKECRQITCNIISKHLKYTHQTLKYHNKLINSIYIFAGNRKSHWGFLNQGNIHYNYGSMTLF